MEYYLRLISNLDENTMVNLAIPHIIALLGILTCGLMLYLALLVYRASPSDPKNRFLSLLLATEGIGAGVLYFFRIYPFPPEAIDFLFNVRYISGTSGTIRIMLYASIIVFYLNTPLTKKVRSFYKSKWILSVPVVGFLLMIGLVSALGGEVESVGDMSILECTESGEGRPATYSGGDFIFNTECPESLEPIYPVSISVIGVGNLQTIHLLLICISMLIATMFLYRLDRKEGNADIIIDIDEVKAMRFGFLVKLIFTVGATVLVVAATNLIYDAEEKGLVNDILQDNLFYPALLSATVFMNIFGSFLMGVLFTYAILKKDVLGIDEQLRKTLTGTIFAGIGAVAFIAGTELMENLAGVGWLGAVVIGIGLITSRKTINAILSSVATKILPEVHTKDETTYLELYGLATEDGKINQKERNMLDAQAKSYGLTQERVKHLEAWYHENYKLNESEE